MLEGACPSGFGTLLAPGSGVTVTGKGLGWTRGEYAFAPADCSVTAAETCETLMLMTSYSRKKSAKEAVCAASFAPLLLQQLEDKLLLLVGLGQ